MNNDQQDDLVFFDQGNKLMVQLNNGLGRNWKKIEGPVLSNNVWAGLVSDFNNDGIKEIVCGTVFSEIRIYSFNYELEQFVLYWQSPEGFFVQNMNSVDINSDGYLDLFMCDDKGENKIYLNDQNGGFTQSFPIDFTTSPLSDKSGNYGSIFVDFDLDGDEDLYISKCSAFATQATDPRRINQLFVNDGNGNFEERALDYGLAFGDQTWVSDFADIDLDGDLDILVANHESDLLLLENMGNGTYDEIQDASGLELKNSFWQVSFQDMDNDGYKDILISANDFYYYHNNGNKTFSLHTLKKNALNTVFTHSIGDYNQDGFLDICTAYGYFQDPNLLSDSIWLNQGNDHNWVSFILEGTTINRDAVGARIDLYSAAKKQMNQVKIGHSYGIIDTKELHFGLGNNSIDSIVIHWTKDDIQIVKDLDINRKYFIKQGACVQAVKSIFVPNEGVICKGDVLELQYDDSDFQLWSNGQLSNEVTIEDETEIYAIYGEDCLLNTHKIFPLFQDTSKIIKTEAFLKDAIKPCPKEEIILRPIGDQIVWNGTMEQDSFISIEEGIIQVEYKQACEVVEISYERSDLKNDFLVPEEVIKYDKGDSKTIQVINPEAKWYDILDEEPFYKGSSYTFENIQSNRLFYVQNYFEFNENYKLGLVEKKDASAPANTVNVRVFFTVHFPMKLRSVDVYTSVFGDRKFELFSLSNMSLIKTWTIDVGSEKAQIDFDIDLEPGSYYLSTDANTNFQNFGTPGPIFLRESGNYINYPYEDESGLLSITGNSLSMANSYYSFYNWQIAYQNNKTCVDEIYPVQLEDVNFVEETEKTQIVLNNPVSDYLNIEYERDGIYRIYNMEGLLLQEGNYRGPQMRLNIEDIITGVYMLSLDNQVVKFVKVD